MIDPRIKKEERESRHAWMVIWIVVLAFFNWQLAVMALIIKMCCKNLEN